MATQKEQPTISRTLRAAVRIGEDFYTLEETITLPIDASEDDIARAVAAGLRIYEAQRTAAETQIRDLRAQVVSSPLPIQIREPDAPASEKQRAYMDYLLNELAWDNDRLHGFASERHLDLLHLTKREASELIDDLKKVLDARNGGGPEDQATPDTEPEAEGQPPTNEARQSVLPVGDAATPRQVKALERLAEERGIDSAAELTARYDGRSFDELTIDEAGALLTEWQQRPRSGRSMRRAA